jgi:hypothetical protein
MPLPSSGPLTLSEIQTEFGGTNPISINEYYAGGANVPAGTTGTFGAVPSSGTISIQNFYGTTKTVAPIGQQEYTTAGTYTFVVPTGVTSVCAVTVGGGGAGIIYTSTAPRQIGTGGGGGGLAYKNNIAVTPGESLTVIVGIGGTPTNTNPSQSGGLSSLRRGGTSLCEATGGEGGRGTSSIGQTVSGGVRVVSDGGGSGGNASAAFNAASGGGGAGGYSGNGGNAGSRFETQVPPTAGAGGGGGGGNRTNVNRGGSGGGGVGILGQGANGNAAASETAGGGGGSSGGGGVGTLNINGGRGGSYGGGGGGVDNQTGATGGAGGVGAVRIIWGSGRAFPSTNTGNL